MSNSITQGKTYVPYLDLTYVQNSKSAILDANENLVREGANGKDILVAKMSLVGLANHSRSGDYVAGDVTLAWETITPSYDRSRMFTVDAMENQETIGLAFGALAGEFQRAKVIPEIDAYRFAAYAGTANISTVNGATLSNAAEVLTALTTAVGTMKEDQVEIRNCVLFITPTLLGLVKAADTTVSREVLNEFQAVVEVPQTRFYTQIDLAAGANSADGGYVKNSSAGKDINFMIIDRTCVVQANKHQVPKVVTPEQNQTGDNWKFGFRSYGVAEVMDNKVDGVYLHKKA